MMTTSISSEAHKKIEKKGTAKKIKELWKILDQMNYHTKNQAFIVNKTRIIYVCAYLF